MSIEFVKEKIAIDKCYYISESEFCVVFKSSGKELTTREAISSYVGPKFKVATSEISTYVSDILDYIIVKLEERAKAAEPKEKEIKIIRSVSPNNYTANVLWWIRFYTIDKDKSTVIPIIKATPLKRIYKKILISSAVPSNVYTLFKGMTFVDEKGMTQRIADVAEAQFRDAFEKTIENIINSGPHEDRLYGYWKYIKDGTAVIPLMHTYFNDNFKDFEASSAFHFGGEIQPFSNDADITPCWKSLDRKTVDSHFGGDDSFIVEWINEVFDKEVIHYLRSWMYGITVDNFPSIATAYIHDPIGGLGKSTFLAAYVTYLENLCAGCTNSISAKTLAKEFYATMLVDRRFCFDDDCKNPRVMSFEAMHKLSSMCTVEPKGKDSYTAKIDVRCMIMSNMAPEIDVYQRNQTRRILYFRMKMFSEKYLRESCIINDRGEIARDSEGNHLFKVETNFVSLFFNQMAAFIANSKPFYDQIFSNSMDFPRSDYMISSISEGATSTQSINFEEFFEKYLIRDDTEKGFVISSDLNTQFKENVSQSKSDWQDFKTYMVASHKIEQKRVTLSNKYGDARKYAFVGVRGAFTPPDELLTVMSSKHKKH